MSYITNDPYDRDLYTVKQYGDHTVKITYCKTMRKAGWESPGFDGTEPKAKKGTVNGEKLSNNLSRAKSTVREYALCNPWDYWCTLTISPEKHDRYDLNGIMTVFGKWVQNYNARCEQKDKVVYLLVPEKHQDGAWHLHGFIKGIKEKDLYVNKYGHLTWKQYEKKFGFISMDRLKDQDKASSYVTKYMTKDTDKSVTELNKRSFYASKGLQKAVELYKGKGEFLSSWDWEHPDGYCKIKTLDVRKDNIHDYIEVYE